MMGRCNRRVVLTVTSGKAMQAPKKGCYRWSPSHGEFNSIHLNRLRHTLASWCRCPARTGGADGHGLGLDLVVSSLISDRTALGELMTSRFFLDSRKRRPSEAPIEPSEHDRQARRQSAALYNLTLCHGYPEPMIACAFL
jgi:hypothetical protein